MPLFGVISMREILIFLAHVDTSLSDLASKDAGCILCEVCKCIPTCVPWPSVRVGRHSVCVVKGSGMEKRRRQKSLKVWFGKYVDIAATTFELMRFSVKTFTSTVVDLLGAFSSQTVHP